MKAPGFSTVTLMRDGAETNNSWFEIAQQVSESLYNLLEVRGTKPEDTAEELQNAVKLIIIKKR